MFGLVLLFFNRKYFEAHQNAYNILIYLLTDCDRVDTRPGSVPAV